MTQTEKKKGIIQAISQKEKTYSIKVESDWFSAFGECPAKKGDLIEFEFARNGNYKNIKTVITITPNPNPAPPIIPSSEIAQMSAAKNMASAAMNALNNASEICKTRALILQDEEECSREKVLEEAQFYLKFIKGE